MGEAGSTKQAQCDSSMSKWESRDYEKIFSLSFPTRPGITTIKDYPTLLTNRSSNNVSYQFHLMTAFYPTEGAQPADLVHLFSSHPFFFPSHHSKALCLFFFLLSLLFLQISKLKQSLRLQSAPDTGIENCLALVSFQEIDRCWSSLVIGKYHQFNPIQSLLFLFLFQILF